MGADSQRRFYRGRPRPSEVPYVPETPPAVPKAHRKNQQRQRQAAAAAALSAGDIVGLLAQPATAADGCKGLVRLSVTDEGRTSADGAGCLEALIAALQECGEADAAVARHGCTVVAGLCRTSAERQASAASLGVFAATAACARAHPSRMVQACAAIEALCTGKGAAARREQAVAAGWLELLIGACSSSGDDDGGVVEDGSDATEDRARLVALAALRSITRDSMALQQKALDAGAARQWLL